MNATDPTSTVFTAGAGNNLNYANGNEVIAYCFASISGFSSIGSYTGVSSGVTITTGFRPSFMMVKSTSNTENWAILDTARGTGKVLNPNLDVVEGDSALNTFTVSDTGFSFPDQSIADAMLNENGYEYFYMAFKENPSTTVVPAGEMAFLLVAGGGGGGISYGGGGGAGGLRTSFGSTSGGGASAESNITLANGIYNVTIGAGGAGISAAATGNSGSNSSISGNATFSTVFAGGGGAGSEGSTNSTPGIGGGGKGGYASSSSPTSGIENTGGGGGGSGNTTSVTSGAGGSGVAILRMRTSDYSGTTSGSPIVRVYGEETILVFTGSGSYTHS